MSNSCDPMDCSPPGFSVHGILQARILEWVAISFSRRTSWLRDQTRVSCIAGRFFTSWATRETLASVLLEKLKLLVQISCWIFLTIGYSSAFCRNIKPVCVCVCVCVTRHRNTWTYLTSYETFLVHLFCICSINTYLTYELENRSLLQKERRKMEWSLVRGEWLEEVGLRKFVFKAEEITILFNFFFKQHYILSFSDTLENGSVWERVDWIHVLR